MSMSRLAFSSEMALLKSTGVRSTPRPPSVETRVNAFGVAVILCVIVLAIWSEKGAVLPALASAGGPALALNLLAVSVGWGAAALFGLVRAERIAVGLECGLQSFAMAAFIALTLLRDPTFLLPGIAYGLLMWTGAIAVVLVARRAAMAPPTIET